MSDTITVSGGGSIIVATDALLTQAQTLAGVSLRLQLIQLRAGHINAMVTVEKILAGNGPVSTLAAEESVRNGTVHLRHLAQDATGLSMTLHAAMVGYGIAEEWNQQVARRASAGVGYLLGMLAPVLAVAALPTLAMGVGGTLLMGAASGHSPAEVIRSLGIWLKIHNDVLTNDAVVALIRNSVGSSDDFLGGLFRVPGQVMAIVGDEGAGVTGMNTSSALLVLLGTAAGLTRQEPVSVTPVATFPAAPPRDFASRIAQIPEVKPGGPQIRIVTYSRPGMPDRFDVYIGGTVDFGLSPDEEPFNLASALAAEAELRAGSVMAVREAMAAAGITADSEIMLTGYSQGGLIASVLANSEDFTVNALVTVASPSGSIAIPAGIETVHLRHTNDLVPALGGHDVNKSALVLERTLFDGEDIPSELALPAHQLEYYRETAALVDESTSSQVTEMQKNLDDFTRGYSSGEATMYRASYSG